MENGKIYFPFNEDRERSDLILFLGRGLCYHFHFLLGGLVLFIFSEESGRSLTTCDSVCVRGCEVWEKVHYPRGMGVRNEDTQDLGSFSYLLAS